MQENACESPKCLILLVSSQKMKQMLMVFINQTKKSKQKQIRGRDTK